MLKYDDLTKDDLRNLLTANWMTHDALWLKDTAERFGISEINSINKNAVREMGKTEARRISKALKTSRITNFSELKDFVDEGFKIIKGSFMRFVIEYRDPDTLIWKVPRCFSYEGVTRLGLIEGYDCGIVERLLGWFDYLEIEYTKQPEFSGCMKHAKGFCEMAFAIKGFQKP